MVTILLAIVAMNSMALAESSVRCGGKYGEEELNFRRNAVNGVWSASTKAETFMVFVDATRGEKIRVVTAEVVSDVDWEKMRAARDASTDQDFQKLLSRLGSMRVIDSWMGWTPDGFVHVEGVQRGAKFTFSCAR